MPAYFRMVSFPLPLPKAWGDFSWYSLLGPCIAPRGKTHKSVKVPLWRGLPGILNSLTFSHWASSPSSVSYSSGFPTPALVNVVSLCSCKSCWPETQRLPDISAENMGLFRIRRVLQYRVWNHVQVPYTTRERELFYREKKKVGGAIIKNPWLSLVGSLPGKKNLSFFLLPSSFFFIQALLSSPLNSGQSLSCVRLFASPTVFNWGFCLLTFYIHGIQYSPIFSILG